MVCEKDFSRLFLENAPFWHLCTSGQLSGILFSAKEDYVYAMNLTALCASIYKGRVKIYTFQVMSNHFHFVLSGSKEDVLGFFEEFKRRLHRFFASRKELQKLRGFKCNLLEISDLVYLRSLIAYVNRNAFVVNATITPCSYEWGPNRFFFSNISSLEARRSITEISQKERQKIFRTHYNGFPDSFYFTNGYVSPLCYCHISDCEAFFFNSHQYFHFLSRRIEAYADIAKDLGEKIFYTDDEIFSAAVSLSAKKFDVKKLTALDSEQRIEIAKILHFNFRASNKQIARVLGVTIGFVDSLFPIPLK